MHRSSCDHVLRSAAVFWVAHAPRARNVSEPASFFAQRSRYMSDADAPGGLAPLDRADRFANLPAR